MHILFVLMLSSATESTKSECQVYPELVAIPKLQKEIACYLGDNFLQYDWEGRFAFDATQKEKK